MSSPGVGLPPKGDDFSVSQKRAEETQKKDKVEAPTDKKMTRSQKIKEGFSNFGKALSKGGSHIKGQFSTFISKTEWSVAGGTSRSIKNTWNAIRGVKVQEEPPKTSFTPQEMSNIKMGLQQLKDNDARNLKPQLKDGVFSVVKGNPGEMTPAEKKAVGKYLADFAKQTIKENQPSKLSSELTKLLHGGKGNSSEAQLLREIIKEGVANSDKLQELREMHRNGQGDTAKAKTLKDSILTEARINPSQDLSKARELKDLFDGVPFLKGNSDFEIASRELSRENRIEAGLEGRENPFDVKLHELTTALIQIRNDPYLQLGVVVDEKGKPVLDEDGNATFQAIPRSVIGSTQNKLVGDYLSRFSDSVIQRDLKEQKNNHTAELSGLIKSFRSDTSWGKDFVSHSVDAQRSVVKLNTASEVVDILGRQRQEKLSIRKANFIKKAESLIAKGTSILEENPEIGNDMIDTGKLLLAVDYNNPEAVQKMAKTLIKVHAGYEDLRAKIGKKGFAQVAKLREQASALEAEAHSVEVELSGKDSAKIDVLIAQALDKEEASTAAFERSTLAYEDARTLAITNPEEPQLSASKEAEGNRGYEDSKRLGEEANQLRKKADDLASKLSEKTIHRTDPEKITQAKKLREQANTIEEETNEQTSQLRETSDFIGDLGVDLQKSTFRESTQLTAELEKEVQKAGFADIEAFEKYVNEANQKVEDGKKLLVESGALISRGSLEGDPEIEAQGKESKQMALDLIREGEQDLSKISAKLTHLAKITRIATLQDSGVTMSRPYTLEEGHNAITQVQINKFKDVINFVIDSQSQRENPTFGEISKRLSENLSATLKRQPRPHDYVWTALFNKFTREGSIPLINPRSRELVHSSDLVGKSYREDKEIHRVINEIYTMSDRVLRSDNAEQRKEILEMFDKLKDEPNWGKHFMNSPRMQRLDTRLRLVDSYKKGIENEAEFANFLDLVQSKEADNDPGVPSMLQDIGVSIMKQTPEERGKNIDRNKQFATLMETVGSSNSKIGRTLNKQIELMGAHRRFLEATDPGIKEAQKQEFVKLMTEMRDTPMVKELIKDKSVRDLVRDSIPKHPKDKEQRTLLNRMNLEDVFSTKYDNTTDLQNALIGNLGTSENDPVVAEMILGKAREILDGQNRTLACDFLPFTAANKAMKALKKDFQMLALYDKIKNDPLHATDRDKEEFMKMLSNLSNDKAEDRVYINNRMLLNLSNQLKKDGFSGGIVKHTSNEEF